MIGVVPINVSHASSESCKSVYPIAIANCDENRYELHLVLSVSGYNIICIFM